MRCKLCLEEKPLIKKSHIIPDFQYKEMFDEKHRIIRISQEEQRSFSIPDGEYEPNILCADCDNVLIGGWESYASQIFYGGTNPPIIAENFRKPDGLEFLQVRGVDYEKFRLFLLSVVWRASISKRPFFANVSLGPHEEKIRRILIDRNPGKANQYPCLISTYRKGVLPKEVIAAPKKIRIHGNSGDIKKIGYSFLIGGFLFMYKISENENDDAFLEAAISENGDMMVPHIPHNQATKILNNAFNKPLFP